MISCHVISALSALAFCGMLGYQVWKEEYTRALTVAASAFIGFVFVTALRKLLNAPRPYELYPFYENKPKDKAGESFPSRHAYSAFAIATLLFSVSLPIAIAMTVLALAMCVFRVLLGIHFIRDVTAGALIGVCAGVIGLILI